MAPIAASLNITVDHKHGYNLWVGGNKGSAKAIKAALNATGGPVLVSWEHVNIQYLAEDLGVDKSKVRHGKRETTSLCNLCTRRMSS